MNWISVFVGAGVQRHFRLAPEAATLAPRITDTRCESAGYQPQFGYATIAARSAELCAAHGMGQTPRNSVSGHFSPAPVETDRRPESSTPALFVVAAAPALLKGGPCNPTVNQEAAEDEPIKKGLIQGENSGVCKHESL